MSIYMGEKLYSGGRSSGSGNAGGNGVTIDTLWFGNLSNDANGVLSKSIRDYDFLVAVAGISGSANYQFSGFFSVADIPTEGTPQIYLATPFELNTDKTMKAYCSLVVNFHTETTISVTSKYAQWSSGSLLRLIGIKMS